MLANKSIIPIKTNTTLCNFIVPPLSTFIDNFSREKEPPALARGVVVSVDRYFPCCPPVVCSYVGLGFRGCLTDLLFVGGLGYVAPAWVAFVKQLRNEEAIPLFVEDQFALGRRGIGLRFLAL